MSKKSIAKEVMKRITEKSAAPVERPKSPSQPSKVVKYIDRDMTCAECGASFTWKAEEQEFFTDKGLMHPPKWCHACRKQRRQYFTDHPIITRKP